MGFYIEINKAKQLPPIHSQTINQPTNTGHIYFSYLVFGLTKTRIRIASGTMQLSEIPVPRESSVFYPLDPDKG
jgi:hypothetical protein